MAKVPLIAAFALLATVTLPWGAEAGCIKEDVIQGGLDRSLPCVFQSPLSWEDHKVIFPRSSSALDNQAKAILDRQIDILRNYPGLAFTIWGHVDHEEAKQPDGKALGFQRANAVRDYLVGRGIDPARITTDSRGDRAMIIKDRTEKALAVMRTATTETDDNPRSPK